MLLKMLERDSSGKAENNIGFKDSLEYAKKILSHQVGKIRDYGKQIIVQLYKQQGKKKVMSHLENIRPK